MPHGDGEFDGLIASFAFHEVLPHQRLRACRETARVLKPGGVICLLAILFASAAARTEAQERMGDRWDESEDYPLVWELDTQLREAGISGISWRQTAPCHWVVVGRRVR